MDKQRVKGFKMAVLTNSRHELFAQGLAVGKTQTQAYIDAGYSAKDARAKASRLITSKGNIFARKLELQQGSAKDAQITIARLTEGLLRIADKAEAIEDASGYQAARAAIMDAAKLNGLIIDKAKADISHNIMTLTNYDRAEIARLSKQLDDEY